MLRQLQKYCFSVQQHTEKVQLRGVHIKGNYNDLPNLIFFPEIFDNANNWVNFFKKSGITDYRNVYILNQRNFGDSDQHESFDMEQQTNDVVRFMYENKISTATLAGHGTGAKLAMATGCYHADRVTGVVCLDGGPLDHRYYESFQEMKGYVNDLHLMNKQQSNKDLVQNIKQQIKCSKWRQLFLDNLKSDNQFKFNLDYINRNLQFNKSDSLGAWNSNYGMWTGQTYVIFPEYSRYIFLNTNTLAFYKTCAHVKGLGQDMFAIQGDDNILNHWMYDFEDISFVTARKFLKFLTMYDGVHVLLKDRSEIGKYFVQAVPYTKTNPDHLQGEYSPAHLHHNWRFSNIYEKASKVEK